MISLFLATLTAAASQQASCPDSMTARLNARVTSELSAHAAKGEFSGVILVACNGKTIYSGAYGMANRSTRTANTLDTRFNLGSMNKMWTAIAVAQLVEQKKVDLDAPVGRYLPEVTNKVLRDQVLVRHLLTHTSGLRSYFTRGFLRDGVAITRAADILPFFVDDTLSFTPGARFQYSNAGFATLGMIVERVSGMNYFEYMKRNIIDRAGMKDAAFLKVPTTQPRVAMGYATPPGSTDTTENTNYLERMSSPAGGAFATAGDMVAFSRALWGGTLVSRALVDEFTTGKVDMGGIKYAFGFGEGRFAGWREVGHNGGAPGVSTDFKSFPDQGIDIVVLANIEDPASALGMSLAVSAVTGAPRIRRITR